MARTRRGSNTDDVALRKRFDFAVGEDEKTITVGAAVPAAGAAHSVSSRRLWARQGEGQPEMP